MRGIIIIILLGFSGTLFAQEKSTRSSDKSKASQNGSSTKSKSSKSKSGKSQSSKPTKPKVKDEDAENQKITHKTPPKDDPSEEQDLTKKKSEYGRPTSIQSAELKEFPSLAEDRRQLIIGALTTAAESPWLPYKFGGTDPKDGGFDCSGAMYYVMSKAGLKPPRTSADQYLWLKSNDRLVEVAAGIRSLEHPVFKDLKPGDLLFWGGTYAPADGRTVNITHVALYLGREKKDGNSVMINATDGRSYRGTKANGFGVYDFKLPREGNRAVFMGYGTPPGIETSKAE